MLASSSQPSRYAYSHLTQGYAGAAVDSSFLINVPSAVVNLSVVSIQVLGSPRSAHAPDSGMLRWHIRCMLPGGDGVEIQFFANESDDDGMVIIDYFGSVNRCKSSPVCLFEARCLVPASTSIQGIIEVFIRHRMSRFARAAHASDNIWWCSLALKYLGLSNCVPETVESMFRTYVAETRATRRDVVWRIPEVIR